MKNAYWSVVPSITWWRGDPRRNYSPYYIGDGMGYTALNVAQWVARDALEAVARAVTGKRKFYIVEAHG